MGYIRVLLYLPGPAESPGAAMISGEDVTMIGAVTGVTVVVLIGATVTGTAVPLVPAQSEVEVSGGSGGSIETIPVTQRSNTRKKDFIIATN